MLLTSLRARSQSNCAQCALGPPTPAVSPFDIDAFILAPGAEPLDFPEADSFQSILRSAPLVELPEVRVALGVLIS